MRLDGNTQERALLIAFVNGLCKDNKLAYLTERAEKKNFQPK